MNAAIEPDEMSGELRANFMNDILSLLARRLLASIGFYSFLASIKPALLIISTAILHIVSISVVATGSTFLEAGDVVWRLARQLQKVRGFHLFILASAARLMTVRKEISSLMPILHFDWQCSLSPMSTNDAGEYSGAGHRVCRYICASMLTHSLSHSG